MDTQVRRVGNARRTLLEPIDRFEISDDDEPQGGSICRLKPVHSPRLHDRPGLGQMPDSANNEMFPPAAAFRVPKRRTIFCEGEDSEYFFLLLSGVVRTYRLFEDGRRQILGFRFPGEDFGLTLGQHSVYAYSADAVTDIEVRSVANTSLESCAISNPLLARRLLKLQDHDLCASQAQILLLGRMYARERVAAFLLDLWRRAERFGPGLHDVRVPMTQADIADYIGLTVETVNRIMSRLREAGTISMPVRGVVRFERLEELNRLAAA